MNPPSLGDQQIESYRSWIRKNSELTEFLRIQLRIVVVFILQIALTGGYRTVVDSGGPASYTKQ